MRVESVRSQMVSGFVWLAASRFAAQTISWVITLAVIRILAPADYGLMGMAVLVNSFLMLFNELGLGAAIVQRPDLREREISDVRWFILLLNATLFGMVLISAPSLGRYFREPALPGMLRLVGLVFLVNGVGAASGFMLARRMAFRQKAQAEFAGNFAGAVSTLGFAFAGFGVWSLAGGYLIQHTTTNALYCLYCPLGFYPPAFGARLRSSLQFGSQVAAGKVLWWVSSSADEIIVGRVLGSVQLGYYGLAVQFGSLPLQKLVSLVTQVALPSFSAIQHDEESLRRYYLKLVGFMAFVTFPTCLGMFVVADAAVRSLLGEKWLPMVFPLKLLALATCLRAVETLNTPLLVARNRPGIPLFNSLLQTVVLPLAFLVGSRWGISGVAAAWVCAWPLLYAVVTAQTLRVLGLPVRSYLAALRHPFAGSVAMMLSVFLVQSLLPAGVRPGLVVLLICGSGVITYITYYVLFDRETLRELRSIADIRPKTRPVMIAHAAAEHATSSGQ
jgi:teichuronic acid exporter